MGVDWISEGAGQINNPRPAQMAMHDPLSAFFLVCFLFGAAFTLISVVTGAAHLTLPGGHGLHLGGHGLHLGHGGHGLSLPHAAHGTHLGPAGHVAPAAHIGQTEATGAREGASPLNLGSLLAFLTWFGGVGYLVHTLSPLALIFVFLLAILAGLAGATLVFLFLLKVLVPAQTSMDPQAYRLDGTPARITAGIAAGGTGEITYSKAGTRRSDAARSIDGEPIPRGEEVIILSYQRGVAYVQTLSKYLKSSASEIAARLVALEEQRAIPGVSRPEREDETTSRQA